MSLKVNGQLSVYQPGLQPLPLIIEAKTEQKEEVVNATNQEIAEISSRALSRDEDVVCVIPLIETERKSEPVKWKVTHLSKQPINRALVDHLVENFHLYGYKFAVRSSHANLTDAISLLLRLDTLCDQQHVKDGKSLRDYALSYVHANKAEIKAEIAKQLRSIVTILTKEIYFKGECKTTGKYAEILQQLPDTVSQFVNAYAINLFMLSKTQMHAEFAESEKMINDFIDDEAIAHYEIAIAGCDPTADRLLLWIVTNLFQRSISIWSETEIAFEENHYCRKGIVDDKTIHLIQMKESYGVLLPPKTKRRQLIEYTPPQN